MIVNARAGGSARRFLSAPPFSLDRELRLDGPGPVRLSGICAVPWLQQRPGGKIRTKSGYSSERGGALARPASRPTLTSPPHMRLQTPAEARHHGPWLTQSWHLDLATRSGRSPPVACSCPPFPRRSQARGVSSSAQRLQSGSSPLCGHPGKCAMPFGEISNSQATALTATSVSSITLSNRGFRENARRRRSGRQANLRRDFLHCEPPGPSVRGRTRPASPTGALFCRK